VALVNYLQRQHGVGSAACYGKGCKEADRKEDKQFAAENVTQFGVDYEEA